MSQQLPRRHVILATVALVLQLVLLHAHASQPPARPALTHGAGPAVPAPPPDQAGPGAEVRCQ
ncbi:hypothetical protein ACQPZG_13475 [Streptomyces sp. CA-294286]|uniref:hypothetical protein n=1 Tax=Streptomyces sp. CA-294286 TaxID=3240070 RepID=UPI003D927D7A